MTNTKQEILYDQECRVISCAIQNPESAFKVVETLKPEDFNDARTRRMVAALHEIVLGGGAASAAGVKRKLSAQPDLESLEQDVVPMRAESSELDEFIDYVLEHSRLRQLDDACLTARSQIGTQHSDLLVGDLMQKLIEISLGERRESFTPVERLFDETFEEVAARHDGEVTGYSTSVRVLDKLIGGWQPKKLYIVAGRPGMAKSAFAMQSAAHLAYYHDVPTAFFSIEMPERELMRRIMSNITGVEYWRIEKRYWAQEHLDRIKEHRERMVEMPLYVNDSGAVTLSQIMAKIKGLKLRHEKLGPVFIDYLQLMKIIIPRGGNRDIAIGEVTRAFKVLAKDLNIPVVLLSQVKRAVEERENKRPTIADLRESGNIEQDSDVIIFPYRDSYYSEDPLTEKDCEFIVGKDRAGKVGVANVGCDLDFQKFFDKEGDI